MKRISENHGRTLFTGISFAALAAVLFGASTPFSKTFLGKTEPVLLAGLLYLGSGIVLAIWSWCRFRSKGGTQEANLKRSDFSWLALRVPHKFLDSNRIDWFLGEQYRPQCNVLESPEPA